MAEHSTSSPWERAAELVFYLQSPVVSGSEETESCQKLEGWGGSNPYSTQPGGLTAHLFAELRAAKPPQPVLPPCLFLPYSALSYKGEGRLSEAALPMLYAALDPPYGARDT